MAREFSRAERVAQQIQKDVAQILQRDLKDPRIGMVTVSEVEVSRDLAYAKIYISALLQDDDKAEIAVKQLNESAPYVRSVLAKSIRMRIVPHIKFYLDTSVNEGIRMSQLVDQAIAADNHKAKANQSNKPVDDQSGDESDEAKSGD